MSNGYKLFSIYSDWRVLNTCKTILLSFYLFYFIIIRKVAKLLSKTASWRYGALMSKRQEVKERDLAVSPNFLDSFVSLVVLHLVFELLLYAYW